MEKERLSGRMVQSMTESGKRILFVGKAPRPGAMAENSLVNGPIIRWMEKEHANGQTVKYS